MGGCKCTFRDCTNTSANSPGVHFFHYPLKHRERCLKWVQYANTQQILNLPYSKARNKVICETHFKDECFMNYKKERLVHYAVPTIVRLDNDYFLDYEESDDPSPKLFSPPNKSHLIPPSCEQKKLSLIQSSNDHDVSEEQHEIVDLNAETSTNNATVALSSVDYSPQTKIKKITAAPKILNSYFVSQVKTNRCTYAQESTSTEVLEQDNSNVSIIFEENEIFNEEQEQFQLIQNSDDYIEEALVKEGENYNMELESISGKDILHKFPYKSGDLKLRIIGNNDVNSVNQLNVCGDNIELLEGRIKELEQELAEEKNKHKLRKITQAQVETISTSRQLPAPSPQSVTPLTKTQLFNTVKKYLSPSMATLVRMEMFGGPDRKWKADEKQVSIELLRLGSDVFEYLRDEWRFRLPPIKSVEKWLNENNTVEDDEDL